MMGAAGKPAGAFVTTAFRPERSSADQHLMEAGDALPDIYRRPAGRGQDRRAHRRLEDVIVRMGDAAIRRSPASLFVMAAAASSCRQSPAVVRRRGPAGLIDRRSPAVHAPRRRGPAAPRRARPPAHRHHRPADRARQRRAAHRDRRCLPGRGRGHQPPGSAAPAGAAGAGRPDRRPPDHRLGRRPVPRQHRPGAAQGLLRPPGRASPGRSRAHRRRPLLPRERRDRRRPGRRDRRRDPGRGQRRAPGRSAGRHGPGARRRHPGRDDSRRRRRRPGGSRRRGRRAAPGAHGAGGGRRRPGAARLRRGQRRPHHDHRLRAVLEPTVGDALATIRSLEEVPDPLLAVYVVAADDPASCAASCACAPHPRRPGDAAHRGDGRGCATVTPDDRAESAAAPRRVQPARRAGARRGAAPAGHRHRRRRARRAAARDLAAPGRPELRWMRQRLWPTWRPSGPACWRRAPATTPAASPPTPRPAPPTATACCGPWCWSPSSSAWFRR